MTAICPICGGSLLPSDEADQLLSADSTVQAPGTADAFFANSARGTGGTSRTKTEAILVQKRSGDRYDAGAESPT